MRQSPAFGIAACLMLVSPPLLTSVGAQEAEPPPTIRSYKTVGSADLKVHIFDPAGRDDRPRPALVLLHGGGWNVGEPEWAYSQARRYAAKGLVAIAVQYRLADFQTITPLDAIADTRDAIRWVRTHSNELHVDPDRIAVYAWSAGAHLALAAMLFGEQAPDQPSAAANAFVFLSPAVSVATSGYMRSLLVGRADPESISPLEHVRSGMPPILIANGDKDVVTPVSAARRFCEAVTQANGRCELHEYNGVGHLLTRTLDRHSQEMGPFDPDPAFVADHFARADAFLAGLGYFKD